LILPLLLLQCTQKQQCAQSKPDEDYLSAILCPTDFSLLMSAPLSRQYAQVDAVKLVYDLKTSMLYYINNRKSSFHYDFCTKYLAYEGDLSEFNSEEYGHKGSRRFLLANLNYYHASDVYSVVARFLPFFVNI